MKYLILALTLFLTALCTQAQKPTAPKGKSAAPQQDSISIKGVYSMDTTKAMMLTFTEEQFVLGEKIYILTRLFTPNGEKPLSVGQIFYTSDWKLLKPEKYLQIIPYSW